MSHSQCITAALHVSYLAYLGRPLIRENLSLTARQTGLAGKAEEAP
jgi:hypothetical protein